MTIEKDKLLELAMDIADKMGIKVIDSDDGKHYIGDEELTEEMLKDIIYGEDIDKNEYVYCINCKYGSKLIEYIIRYNGVSIPEQCNSCCLYNPEDSMRYEDRPNYKERV